MVTAAFIGPGTLTTATKAGAEFGYSLAWAILLSVAAAIALQEMSARLGLVTRSGLGEAIRSSFSQPLIRAAAILLVLSAIVFGNAAFEVGNISGAALGLENTLGLDRNLCIVAVSLAALLVLASGIYRYIELLLVILVTIMSVVFVATAIIVKPDIGQLFSSMVKPSIPGPTSRLTIIALIGTTVVPYNLFLHASSAVSKWPVDLPICQALRAARLDTVVSIILGGVITLSVLVSAAALHNQHAAVTSFSAMARQLEPLLGVWFAKYFLGCGLLAAGVTSSITAPLAAAYATAGILGWDTDLKNVRMRAVFTTIILGGMVVSLIWSQSPLTVILLAQAANGLLLPLVALFLLVAINRKSIMGLHTNSFWSNVAGAIVVLTTLGLGVWYVLKSLRVA